MSSFLLAAPGLGEPKLLDQVRQLVPLRPVISFIESLPWTRLSPEDSCVASSDYSRVATPFESAALA
jgi:hypothetical protein